MLETHTLIFLPASFDFKLKLPLASFPVPAGCPSPADDHLDGSLDLNEHLIRDPAATFYVRVSGDSMRGAGIVDGDLRRRLVVVLSNNDGCVIACSNEAKALGFKMGDPYFKVKPQLAKPRRGRVLQQLHALRRYDRNKK
jgi:Peptidase S24-like